MTTWLSYFDRRTNHSETINYAGRRHPPIEAESRSRWRGDALYWRPF